MGANWKAMSMRWKPHVGRSGKIYGLSHLHPCNFELHFQEHRGLPARTVTVHVGFSLHTFTCDLTDAGPDPELYSDDRETRAFDLRRYEPSRYLKGVLPTIEKRKCYFTGRQNYVVFDGLELPPSHHYRIYFDVRKKDPNAVELLVQSAYVKERESTAAERYYKQVGFRVIAGRALLGQKPKPPP